MDDGSEMEEFIASLERSRLLCFPPDVIVAAVLSAMPAVFHDVAEDTVQDFADRLGRALRRRMNPQPADVQVFLN